MALTQTKVSQLYVAIFNRASEGSGNTYWQTAHTNATTTAEAMFLLPSVKTFFDVTNFTDTANVRTVIEAIYLNSLGKAPADDVAGITYWIGQVTGGRSIGDVVNTLVVSATATANAGTAQNIFNNKVTVSNYAADTLTAHTTDAAFQAYLTGVTSAASTVTTANAAVLAAVPVVSSPLTVTSHSDSGYELLTRKIDVFGIGIYAADGVAENKLIHAAHVLAEYLDNDEDGVVDNQLVVDAMIASNATIGLWKNEDDLDVITEGQREFTMDLGDTETRPEWHVNNIPTAFDASLEEVLHSITQNGYALVYPEIFGEETGTIVADAMDVARGGQFIEIPEEYPESAWYTYDDESCDYMCMITEYMYWGLSSILGAHTNRLDAIGEEWQLNTAELVETNDPILYNLLTDDQYKFPSHLPDGNYTPDIL